MSSPLEPLLELGHQFTRKAGVLNEIKQWYLHYLKKIFSHDITLRNGRHNSFVPLLQNGCSPARHCDHRNVENALVKMVDEERCGQCTIDRTT